MDFDIWVSLFLASWVFSLSPGPGSVFSMTNGFNYGFNYGIFGVLGLILGLWIVFLFVVVGVGAIVNTSELVFSIVKWIGVAYLFYLGIKQITSKASTININSLKQELKPISLITQGVMLNLVNPKVYIFFLAIIPLFMSAEYSLYTQYLAISLTFGFTDLIIMSGYTLFASKLLSYLKSESHILIVNKVFGTLFILASIALAIFRI